MNPATIYHRPLSEFAFASDDTHYVFRLRTGKGEAQSCRFFYADRAAMAPELDFACLPMKKIREDRYFDWYEVRLETKLERIAYYFELSDGAETLCYFGDCYEMAGTPTRADFFQLPFNHRADRLSVPERNERGNGHDAEAHGQRLLLVHVHLSDLHLRVPGGELVHHRALHPARAAPIRPKIHQHRLLGLQHFLFKVFCGDLNLSHCYHILSYHRLTKSLTQHGRISAHQGRIRPCETMV